MPSNRSSTYGTRRTERHCSRRWGNGSKENQTLTRPYGWTITTGGDQSSIHQSSVNQPSTGAFSKRLTNQSNGMGDHNSSSHRHRHPPSTRNTCSVSMRHIEMGSLRDRQSWHQGQRGSHQQTSTNDDQSSVNQPSVRQPDPPHQTPLPPLGRPSTCQDQHDAGGIRYDGPQDPKN